ncbi:uncharacterized protein EI97DRAFT_415793 [Westerdykella ornata]|uniref:HTH TFE/IIEalpha-type domain-containing protein n=1 Tax=Westerdykella ornata TaxID=318751 RepID=A0A6A6JPA7_WESOR|nr:uncharacterized protein EI97DRAFT_415793 [Westerdykella ornata]KAF2277973.1 hypothetical protein EI97DRAFT_415793 [Westerdykella ornata]
MANVDPLELAKVFVKTVARMFYETEHIVIVDALVFHGALTTADLCLVLDWGKNSKGVGKFIGKLKQGGLISTHTRQEMREGAMKAISRDYFYIDYRRAIDATKYRLHMLDEQIKKDAAPTQEKKELQCKRCKSQWTHIEVMDCIDHLGRESGFLCKTCGFPLVEIDNEGDADSGDIPAKFNKFFGPLLKLMQQVDEVVIPAVEGHDAVEGAVELPRDKEINPVAKHEVVQPKTTKPTTVKGMTTIAPEKIEVSIATDSEYNEAARAAEQERQAKIAAQNLLPEWHTKSTVITDNANGPSNIKTEVNGTALPVIRAETVDEKKYQETSLDDVFAQIAAEQRENEAKEAEESSSGEEDEEDEDEFEDVVATTSVAPEAKRLKLESSAAPSPAGGITPAASTGDGGDESDEDEFVDV